MYDVFFKKAKVRWPITAMAIAKRCTVNKKTLINKKNVLLPYKKGLRTKKKDLLT